MFDYEILRKLEPYWDLFCDVLISASFAGLGLNAGTFHSLLTAQLFLRPDTEHICKVRIINLYNSDKVN